MSRGLGLAPGCGKRMIVERCWQGAAVPSKDHLCIELWSRRDGLRVHIDAPFHGDPTPPTPAGRCEQLWRYEVAELFILGRGEQYLELEFGPAGHYLALQLAGPRNVVCDDLELDCSFNRHAAGGRWSVTAVVPSSLLPEGADRVNGYAIHGTAPRHHLAYNPVPGLAADFHKLEHFVSLEKLADLP